MAAKPAPTLDYTNPNVNGPPPASYSGSNLNAPFTPRSTTFPDDIDSDDGFDPTPIHSPGGPRYDDLPPSYDEAQQQALQDARAGIPPINPENLEVHRMVMSETLPPPSHPSSQQQSRSGSSLLLDPNAYEFEPQNRQNANGLGVMVPVQQVIGSESIPVGHAPLTGSNSVHPESTSILLNRTLAFTLHEPAADARYAPRLIRCVAIPQVNAPPITIQNSLSGSRHNRCAAKKERRRQHNGNQVPGQWPESNTSSTTLHSNSSPVADRPVEFLRAYAKALHAHDIRPAEFTEFLDGLNSLCLATTAQPIDILRTDDSSSTVQNYIDATNEAFFAPRGLKVSLIPLSSLIDSLKIPEERGQRSGAVASAMDIKSTPDQRAQALYPWIEPLEINVPAFSTQTLITQGMSERLHRQAHPTAQPPVSTEEETVRYTNSEKPQPGFQDTDPAHSVPEATTTQTNGVPFPPFPSFPPQPIPGAWGSWNGQNGGQHGRGWGSGQVPWCPPAQRGSPWPRGPGARCGVHVGGPGGPGDMAAGNSWAAWGESVGKWGEAFGKRMETWGENFGKRAEQWGQNVERQGEQMERWGEDLEKRAETWGQNFGARFSGFPPPNNQNTDTSTAQGSTGVAGSNTAAAAAGPEGLAGQQTGVLGGNTHIETKEEKKVRKQEAKATGTDLNLDDDDDDDVSTISTIHSSSSSSSSDDEDEDEHPDTSALFLARIQSINASAAASRAKGKKPPTEIEQERALAIEKASAQKTALDLKIEEKRDRRAFKRELREKKREFKRMHGKGSRGWKKERRARKADGATKKELKELKRKRKEEHRTWLWEYITMRDEAEKEWKARRKNKGVSGALLERRGDEMVWVVVENLGV